MTPPRVPDATIDELLAMNLPEVDRSILLELRERRTNESEALFCVEQFISCLPQKRDWLNPDVERLSRDVIRRAESLGTHAQKEKADVE